MTEMIVSSPVLSPERPVQDFSQSTVLYGVALSAAEPVVEYSGESVIFNRRNMKLGEPHVFSFRDKVMIAVKRADETIDFYYLPDRSMPFDPIITKKLLDALPGVAKVLEHAFNSQDKDLPVCKTRIVREKRGYIWNNRVAVHPLKDGKLQITPIRN